MKNNSSLIQNLMTALIWIFVGIGIYLVQNENR